MTELIYREESYRIIGACFEVYNELGCGFVEPVYQESLQIEFEWRAMPVRPQVELELKYKGRLLEQKYKPDFLCFDSIVLEIKAVSDLNDTHRAQLQNYLKATGYRLGLLVNFGEYPKLKYERIVR
jgi:GxxExxY protein